MYQLGMLLIFHLELWLQHRVMAVTRSCNITMEASVGTFKTGHSNILYNHWLNMELDLQSLIGLLYTAVLTG
jgi:hypothetical protein